MDKKLIPAEAAEDFTVPENDDSMENQYLTFNVGDEKYGIEIRYVIQLLGMREITTMPDMPPGMQGFINLRGNVIPVVSMRLRFGKEEIAYTQRTCIIVVRVEEREIGLIVDMINETRTIDLDSISPPPRMGKSSDSFYISGIALPADGKATMLIDISALFNAVKI